jgi:hypothetical protein
MGRAQGNASGQAKWTFMVYMAGDDNLDGAALRIVGNLGQDPEIRYTASGVPVASFTVAVNEVYKGKDNQKVKKVHWFRSRPSSAWRRSSANTAPRGPRSASGGSCSSAPGRTRMA